jgi:hypothetical protein
MALFMPANSPKGLQKRSPLSPPVVPGALKRAAERAALSPKMTPSAPPPDLVSAEQPTQARTETVQKLYQSLSHAATDLNAASDELAKPIRVYEGALKKLNLGLSAWVDISSGDQDALWWDRSVGYTKFKDGWAIALRTRKGDYRYPEGDSEELWPFIDAPRWMRIEAVNKLPDLLEALLKQAEETTKKIKAKIAQASEIAEAISKVAEDISVLEER